VTVPSRKWDFGRRRKFRRKWTYARLEAAASREIPTCDKCCKSDFSRKTMEFGRDLKSLRRRAPVVPPHSGEKPMNKVREYLHVHLGRFWDEVPTTVLPSWFATIPPPAAGRREF